MARIIQRYAKTTLLPLFYFPLDAEAYDEDMSLPFARFPLGRRIILRNVITFRLLAFRGE